MTWEKYEKDGNVAVLYSPGFGAGWSTWASHNYQEQATFDSRLVKFALGELKADPYYCKFENIDDLCEEIFSSNYIYTGGWRDIEVVWLEKGTQFQITEYDGSENIQILEPSVGYVA